ncbi:amino acid ABC transporter substrate-binding protein [Rhodomicrobium vannielii ATCC 17100]|uniref:amino acid ABC transporter substrate-binding protein n=1 Tax=Rhodomicrobium vannielii TaxID=1069 RepID=UPI0019196E28|nr:amino acid ABC transporter substrate-binding protein [Rhodomicrobium vannielii]MBJ7534471.1 amino acid ABC transporter substrate-binding protein [Rhodomicrobium vannielii ATCC 17100]
MTKPHLFFAALCLAGVAGTSVRAHDAGTVPDAAKEPGSVAVQAQAPETPPAKVENPESLAAANAEGGVLGKIKAAGAITLGYREAAAPFSYAVDQNAAGFAVDLCGLVADKVKEKLALPELKVVWRATADTDRAELVSKRDIDIDCAATPDTAALGDAAEFSAPVYVSELRFIVPSKLRPEAEGFRRRRADFKTPAAIDDLKGKTVVLLQGSPGLPYVLGQSVERYLGISVVYAKTPAEAFKLVETGAAAAYLDDDAILVGLKAGTKSPDGFLFLNSGQPGADYALVLPKDEPLKDLADATILDAVKSGEYEKLYAKWFESPIPPKNVTLAYPMTERLKQFVKDPAAATE